MINTILKLIKIYQLKSKIKKLETLYELDPDNSKLRKELITHITKLIDLHKN